jgi:hypothetical protein
MVVVASEKKPVMSIEPYCVLTQGGGVARCHGDRGRGLRVVDVLIL